MSRPADGGVLTAPYPQRVLTPRLVLRRWDDDEAKVYAAIWSDPQVARAVHPGSAIASDYGLRVFASRHVNWSLYGFGDWAVQDRASGEVMGTVGLGRPGYLPGHERATDLGWLLRPAHWGRGLASEAARATMDAAFGHLPLDELIAIIAPANTRSISVAQRLGMRARAPLHFHHPYHGAQTVLVHTIARERWEADVTERRSESPRDDGPRRV